MIKIKLIECYLCYNDTILGDYGPPGPPGPPGLVPLGVKTDKSKTFFIPIIHHKTYTH